MDRTTWREQTVEAALEPELPICDSHHHFWDRRPRRSADDRFLLEEAMRLFTGGHNIVSSVFVECDSMYRADGPEELRPAGETEFVQGIAAMSASGAYGQRAIPAAIVGWADPTRGARIEPLLEAHRAASPGRFRGVRYYTSWDPHPEIPNGRSRASRGLMADRTFREGIERLAKFDFVFDALVFFHQLPELADLARAVPRVTFVLEHVGLILGIGPYAARREEVLQEWRRGIAQVAQCPNVVVKLGGFGTGRAGWDWASRAKPPGSEEVAQAIGPHVLYCIEHFGPQRAMFESNFPVDGNSYSYNVVWNAFKRITRDFSSAERAALYHDTAARVYRFG